MAAVAERQPVRNSASGTSWSARIASCINATMSALLRT